MKLFEFLPERFGFFHTDGKGVSYTYKKYKVKYKELLQEYYSRWEQVKLPFGMSLKDINDNCVGICIDIDAHHGENIEPDIETFKSLFSPIKYSIEGGGKGVKFWVIFDDYIPFKVLEPFLKWLNKVYKHEVFPNDQYFIRFPGLYKDRFSYSSNLLTGEILDTLEKIKTFLGSAENSTGDILKFIEGFKIVPEEEKPRKKREQVSLNETLMATGMDDFFEVIWEHIVGPMPELEEKFSCPFHEDETPSASIFRASSGKLLFCCYSDNCKMRTDKDNVGRDALDILHYHLFKNSKLTMSGIEISRDYLDKNILMGIFRNFLIPVGKHLEVNMIKLSEYIFTHMTDNDVRRDENGVLYQYVKPLWREIKDHKQGPNIIRDAVVKTLEKEFRKEGVYYLGAEGISSLSKLVDAALTNPQNTFEEAKWKIPFKNGILDVPQYLEGKGLEALVPIKKEDFIVSTLNCNFDPTAVNEKFESTIKFFLPDETVRSNFLQYIGTCLVPSIKLSKIMFCIGTGGNGKGTMLSIISELFGAKCSAVKFGEMDDKFATHELYGSWLNIDPDSVMDGITQRGLSIIKTCTGDGSITIQKKFGQLFKYVPLCKFIIACNQIPSLGDINEAIARRFMDIPFTQKVPTNNYGGYWEEVVGGEQGMSGIANLLLKYLKVFISNGRQFDTSTSNVVREEFCKETDPIYRYIDSLFMSNLNDPIKYPIMNNKRLSDNELIEGVTGNQLFQDFILYLGQTIMTKTSIKRCNTVIEFGRRLNEKIKDSVLPSEYRDLIKPVRIKNERGYSFDILKIKNPGSQPEPKGAFVGNL